MPPPFDYNKKSLKEAAIQLNEEGYFQLNAVIPNAETAPLLQGMNTLNKAGIMGVFCMLYDEYWQLFYRLNTVFKQVIGKSWYALPDIWGFYIQKGQDHAGWKAHRDLNDLYVDNKGNPIFFTIWVSLSKATPLNSCIYVLPTHLDPFYPNHLREFPSKPENFYNFSFENIRALPVEPGSVLGWNVNTVHWGSRSSKHAEEERASLAFYLKRDDKKDNLHIDFSKTLSFNDRMKMVCENIFRYKKRVKIKPFVVEFSSHFASPSTSDWE